MLNGIVTVLPAPIMTHEHLAQYGCDGTHEEAGRGRELVETASVSLPHPVVRLSI
jgi:hypothetical protein